MTKKTREEVLANTIQRFKEKGLILPTYEQMRNPELVPQKIKEELKNIGLWDFNPLNLFRLTWKNDPETGEFGKVNYFELPTELTGVKARIFVLTGKYFPTGAHKVGATFGPLVEKLINGTFDINIAPKEKDGSLLSTIENDTRIGLGAISFVENTLGALVSTARRAEAEGGLKARCTAVRCASRPRRSRP